MAAGIEIRIEPLRTAAFGAISGTYSNIGTAFAHPISLLQIQNLTNAQCTFSFAGGTDHLVLPANGQVVYDGSANAANNQTSFYFSKGTQLQVKGSPSSGSVYVTTMYARGA